MRSWRAIGGALVDPVGTFRALVETPRILLVLVLVAAAHLALPLALIGHLDVRTQVLAEQGPKLADMTDRDIEEAVTQKQTLTEVLLVAKSLVGPPVLAFELTLVLWLWGRYLRSKPGFGALYSLCAHAQIPLGLRSLAQGAVVLSRGKLSPQDLDGLLASSLAPLWHGSAALAKALTGADLFLLWTAALLGVALYAAGKMPPLRAALGMAVAYAAFVAVFLVALPTMGGA